MQMGEIIPQEIALKLEMLSGMLNQGSYEYTTQDPTAVNQLSFFAHLIVFPSGSHLELECGESWKERTLSGVMLGASPIKHTASRIFSIVKMGEDWFLQRGEQTIRDEFGELSNRTLGVQDLDTYVTATLARLQSA